MTESNSLAAETVVRPLPINFQSGDEALFEHEIQKNLPSTVPRTGRWDFTEGGLLLAGDSGRVDELSFQGRPPRGLSGVKTWLRATLARRTHRRVSLALPAGHRALVVTDEFSNGFFHWVAEALPKLWWAEERLDKAVLVLPAYAKRFPYMAESLALWPQLKIHVVSPATLTALGEAIVLPALAPTGNFRPALIRGLAQAWRQRVAPQLPHRKLFVSRARAPWRRIRNEDEVWALLEKRGFERVFLEALDFAAQVRLLAETAWLVSNHGAGLTNLLFMLPGTRLLEIRLRGDSQNNCYFSLAAAAGLEYAYLQADSAAGADSHTADVVVDPDQLLRTLEALD